MTDQLNDFGQWLQRNDVTIDLITVWALATGFALFGITKVLSWWTLRRQNDATMVGVTLKRQKMVEALIGFGMATLYGMTLFAYYMAEPVFNFWDRLLLRSGLFVVMVLGSVFCVQFVWALRRESGSGRQGQIPLAEEEER